AIAQTQLTVDQANQQYEAGQISFVQYEAALKRELANFDRQANLSPEQQDQRAKILKTLADATNQNVLSGQKLLQQISSLSGEDTFESQQSSLTSLLNDPRLTSEGKQQVTQDLISLLQEELDRQVGLAKSAEERMRI